MSIGLLGPEPITLKSIYKSIYRQWVNASYYMHLFIRQPLPKEQNLAHVSLCGLFCGWICTWLALLSYDPALFLTCLLSYNTAGSLGPIILCNSCSWQRVWLQTPHHHLRLVKYKRNYLKFYFKDFLHRGEGKWNFSVYINDEIYKCSRTYMLRHWRFHSKCSSFTCMVEW